MTAAASHNGPTVCVPRFVNIASEYVDGALAAGHGARTAYRSGDVRLSYAQLQQRVNRAGNALRELGLQATQRVALLLPNGVEFVISFFGAAKLGAVPLPMSFAITPGEQAHLLADSEAGVLITTEALWKPLSERRAGFPLLRNVVLVDRQAREAGIHSFWQLLEAASSHLHTAPTTADDMAFWLHTSGTTGRPKWAVHLQRAMLYCQQLYAAPFVALRADDVVVCGSPCFHAYPLAFTTYFALKAGAMVVLNPERSTPRRMFQLIREHRATVLVGVPTLYAQMLHAADAGLELSSLRACFSAAEPLPADLYRRWRERFGVEILDGLGATETLQTFISNRAGEARAGSAGKVVPGYRVRLVDPQGADVADGEVGDLMVSGGSLFGAYWRNPELTGQVLREGWYRTGDKCRRDADGYYWYIGRSDDLLRVSGHWISPAEVEAALATHPAVLEAAVVGARDEDELVKPKAFVVPREGHEPCSALAEELKAHVKRTMAAYNYPRWIEFCESLPKTATGKIQRHKLRHAGVAAREKGSE